MRFSAAALNVSLMGEAVRVLGSQCDCLLTLQMLKEIASDGMERLSTAEERVPILVEVREASRVLS